MKLSCKELAQRKVFCERQLKLQMLQKNRVYYTKRLHQLNIEIKSRAHKNTTVKTTFFIHFVGNLGSRCPFDAYTEAETWIFKRYPAAKKATTGFEVNGERFANVVRHGKESLLPP
jgi:hypothetical protein